MGVFWARISFDVSSLPKNLERLKHLVLSQTYDDYGAQTAHLSPRVWQDPVNVGLWPDFTNKNLFRKKERKEKREKILFFKGLPPPFISLPPFFLTPPLVEKKIEIVNGVQKVRV